MANFFSRLFGKPKKVQEYSGPKPYESLTEIPVGKSLNDAILSGMSGKGWGMPEGYVERATSPFIRNIEANAPKVQRETQDIYSARGLGRGTAVARDLGEVAAQRERDINQILAQAYEKDIDQRKVDEARYQNLAVNFAGQEAGQKGQAAAFGVNRFDDLNSRLRQYNADDTGYVSRIVGTGASLLAPVVGRGISGIPAGFVSSSGVDTSKLSTGELAALERLLGGM